MLKLDDFLNFVILVFQGVIGLLDSTVLGPFSFMDCLVALLIVSLVVRTVIMLQGD